MKKYDETVQNFASMSLNPNDYHCEPEEVSEIMISESVNFFGKVFRQLKKGKTCKISLESFYSDYLVADLQDSRNPGYYLPDDNDLLYPIQNIRDEKKLASEIEKRAMKYREGVYVWLIDGADKDFMQEEMLRLEAEEKAQEQLKQRLNVLGLKWMNKEQSRNELERLLSGIENQKQTLDDLETAQWHYMDVVGITLSGLFDEDQLKQERRDQPHLIKKEGGLTVFEDDQCILFMSKKHDIPLPLCAAYVLSDAWR